MLNVTDAAAEQLDIMLAEAPEGAAIRFAANGNQLEPRLDNPREGDTTYKHGERVVLLVEPPMAEALKNGVLDVQTGEEGKQLTLSVEPPEEEQSDES